MRKWMILLMMAASLLLLYGCSKKEESSDNTEVNEETNEGNSGDLLSGLHHAEINIKDYGTVAADDQPVIESIKVVD